ncbi:TonB-dependent receptor [Pedobacter sp. HMWF019]|uniref:SusC/RagA family TonB-linked outer membrane protein n=1 Tax=Pedobacter sp. HMWF019 TaxID=2056856 RepID=UPI000D340594|nr:TonB-dependent receptor [Pedobacter sp. HMWF019]PTT00696.1 TonB-dependent receptor [Pedobacter sp. HMWF019]
MKKIKYLLTLFFLFPLVLLAQQSVTISGKIIDAAAGAGLPGVSVKIKGTTIVAVTDQQGKFSIIAPNTESYLQISYVGYMPQEIQIKNKKDFQITLQEDNKNLDELVVVGYGTQKKVTVTGAVSTLKSEEITVTKNENVVNMLTGKIPGLRVLQKTAEPGSFENQFDIRGLGNPLIVIDGVPRGGIERMDPNEIESISVLKDGAASIYGVRAANGVILVTTKKGDKNGKFDINYSVNQGWQQFLGMPEGVGPVDFMMLTNEKTKRAFANNFVSNSEPTYTYADMKPWLDGTSKGADWIGLVFKKTSPQIQHNLNVNGGTEKITYFFNLGYMKQDGIFKTNSLDYNRYNFRSNVNINISKRLRAQILASGYTDEKNQPYQDLWTIFKYTWNQIPINRIFANDNPEYPSVMSENANPAVISDATKVGYKKQTQKNFQGQLSLEYDIPGIEGLKAKGMFNYGYSVDDNTEQKKEYKLYTYNAVTDTYVASLVKSPTTLMRYYGNNMSTLSQLSLNYAHTFNKDHNVSGLLLFEESFSKGDNFFAQRNVNLPINYLFGGEAGDQIGSMNTGNINEVVYRAYVGRVNYDYKGKYLAEFSFRQDGSNKFKPGKSQWGFFPAASIGWRITEEGFFKNFISPDILSNLKLRVSYGKAGYDTDTQFQYIPGYNYPTINPNDQSIYGYIFNGQFISGAAPRPAVNNDLTWYTTSMKNIGLDFSLWRGKLEGTFDIFRRDRNGLLARRDVAVPGTVGIDLPEENLNTDRTEGLEFSLNYRGKAGEFGYNIGGNISTTRTMNRFVIETKAGNEYLQWRNGKTNRYNNLWWGKTYGGQFSSYDQIYNHPVNAGGGNNNTVPGDYYYQDWNEDGVINEKDEKPIATKDIPLINYGINIGLTWKGFDLNALFAGSTSFYVEYTEQYAQPLMYDRSSLSQFLDSWHTVNPSDNVFNPNTRWIPGKYPAMGSPIAEGTKAVQDASYIRLKTLELGYSLPFEKLKRIGVKKLRIYANAYNLLTLTKLKNSDPEHPGQIPDAGFNQSLGGYKYPLNRTFNLGANITF